MAGPVRTIKFNIKQTNGRGSIDDVKELLRRVFDRWEKEFITVKQLSRGYINTVFKAWHGDEDNDGAVIIKVFANAKTKFMTETTSVVPCILAAEASHCNAEVFASFANGIIYGYKHGVVLDPAIYDSDHLRRKIAIELANFHHIEVPSQIISHKPRIFSDLNKALYCIPEDLGNLFISSDDCFERKSSFSDEVEWLKREILRLKCDTVFSHGNLWWGNIMYDESIDSIHFVDFDLCGYNPLPCDLARYLVSARSHLKTGKVNYLTEAEEKRFIRCYLERRIFLSGSRRVISKSEVDRLYGQVVLFKPFVILTLMALFIKVCVITPEDDIVRWLKTVGPANYRRAKEDFIYYSKLNRIIGSFFVIGE